MKPMVVFFILLTLPALVSGDEVYQWVDEQGVVHFTDNPATVPETYRAEGESRHMPENQPASPITYDMEEEDEGILIEDDLKEKDEVWWRSRAEKWRKRLENGYDGYEKVRLRYNALATEFNTSKDPEEKEQLKTELDEMQQEMDEFKREIEGARKMTDEVLPSQVQKAGKPLEWVR
jgi:archaellum component FlaC